MRVGQVRPLLDDPPIFGDRLCDLALRLQKPAQVIARFCITGVQLDGFRQMPQGFLRLSPLRKKFGHFFRQFSVHDHFSVRSDAYQPIRPMVVADRPRVPCAISYGGSSD